MRISDWSSDVCSSDLGKHHAPHGRDQAGHQVSVASIGTGAEVRPATARANGPEVPGNAIAVARSCAGAWVSPGWPGSPGRRARSEEHTSELQSLMRISYAVFCLKKKIPNYMQRHKYKDIEE